MEAKNMEQSCPRWWLAIILLFAGIIGLASPWKMAEYFEWPLLPAWLDIWVSVPLVVLGAIGVRLAYRYANTDQSQQ